MGNENSKQIVKSSIKGNKKINCKECSFIIKISDNWCPRCGYDIKDIKCSTVGCPGKIKFGLCLVCTTDLYFKEIPFDNKNDDDFVPGS